MTTVEFSGLIFLSSLAAGLLGALTGLGGGVVIVPVLTLLFHVDIRYAIGASLVSVIATSSGAAAAYVREGYSNVRIGMFLEIATTLGAVLGAWLTTRVPTNTIGFIFALVLLYSAVASWRKKESHTGNTRPNKLAERLRLRGSFPVVGGKEEYVAQHVPAGFGLMFSAGTLSGLLGIGSGAVKVLAMDQAMGLPFKVSTTTSNFMIGVTAAASAGVYFTRGDINPFVAAPVACGVLLGATAGSKLLGRLQSKLIRLIFVIVLLWVSAEMFMKGVR